MLKYFSRIAPDKALEQHNRIAEQVAKQIEESRKEKAKQELLERGPGRPKRERDANEVLMNASHATDSTDDHHSNKRGKYCNWFASPFIHDIIAAYHLNLHDSRATVVYLQRTFPRLPTESSARYEQLAESTIRTWFDSSHKLLPKFAALLEENKSPSRGEFHSVLSAHPFIDEEIKRLLKVIREKGGVVNILVIRCIMRAVILKNEPELLTELKLGNSFISYWARAQMNWSWRRSTTAASKLPENWHQQGIDMAKRIAALMEMYEVEQIIIYQLRWRCCLVIANTHLFVLLLHIISVAGSFISCY